MIVRSGAQTTYKKEKWEQPKLFSEEVRVSFRSLR